MVKLNFLWLQAACVNAQFLTSQSWSTWTSTLPNGQVSVADAWDCQRVVTLSGTISTQSGCPNIWWHRLSTTSNDEPISATKSSTALFTCSTLTWAYGTNMPRNFTMPQGSSYSGLKGSSYSDYKSSSYGGYKMSLSSDSTETITSTISRILTANLLNAVTKSTSMTTSNEVVVGPAVIETLTTRIVPAETVTETHTHSAIVMTTLTTSILCICGESGLLATGKTFCRFRFQSSLCKQKPCSQP